MQHVVVRQECIEFDKYVHEEHAKILANDPTKQNPSELLTAEKFYAANLLKTFHANHVDGKGSDKGSEPDVVPLLETDYMKRRFNVYHPHKINRSPMLIRVPCTVPGTRVSYLEMIDSFETLAKYYKISDRHLVDLIKFFDRYVPDHCCKDCFERHPAYIVTREVDIENVKQYLVPMVPIDQLVSPVVQNSQL
jgi:hypothetical protein